MGDWDWVDDVPPSAKDDELRKAAADELDTMLRYGSRVDRQKLFDNVRDRFYDSPLTSGDQIDDAIDDAFYEAGLDEDGEPLGYRGYGAAWGLTRYGEAARRGLPPSNDSAYGVMGRSMYVPSRQGGRSTGVDTSGAGCWIMLGALICAFLWELTRL